MQIRKWIGRIRGRSRINWYQDFVAPLSNLRIQADQLGLLHPHNRLAVALCDAPMEIRSQHWGTR